jgi:hypothetical protein
LVVVGAAERRGQPQMLAEAEVALEDLEPHPVFL